MSQTGTQTIAINTLQDFSKNKGNQTMTFGQLKQYNVRNIFLQNSRRNKVRRLVPNLFLFFKSTLYELKASG